jgi:hypothetical protein
MTPLCLTGVLATVLLIFTMSGPDSTLSYEYTKLYGVKSAVQVHISPREKFGRSCVAFIWLRTQTWSAC